MFLWDFFSILKIFLSILSIKTNATSVTDFIMTNHRMATISKMSHLLPNLGGFHLHLLVFPFVYQFNSRIGVLVHSSFANDEFRRISTTFQHHFKICLLWFLHEKECSFYSHLFCCTEMRWLFISSTAIWVTGSDTGSVASRARTELTSSKCDWTRIWAI